MHTKLSIIQSPRCCSTHINSTPPSPLAPGTTVQAECSSPGRSSLLLLPKHKRSRKRQCQVKKAMVANIQNEVIVPCPLRSDSRRQKAILEEVKRAFQSSLQPSECPLLGTLHMGPAFSAPLCNICLVCPTHWLLPFLLPVRLEAADLLPCASIPTSAQQLAQDGLLTCLLEYEVSRWLITITSPNCIHLFCISTLVKTSVRKGCSEPFRYVAAPRSAALWMTNPSACHGCNCLPPGWQAHQTGKVHPSPQTTILVQSPLW